MTLTRGATGPQVTDFQQALLEVGETLPRFGADGNLGDETLAALGACLVKHGRRGPDDPDPDTVDGAEFAFVYALRELLRAPRPVAANVLSINLVDRRAHAGLTKDGGPRAWTQIKGWTLHQTACWLSSSRDIARCDGIGAHYVVYPDGRVFKLHDVNRVVWHGNGFNAQTIGIEIDGLFAGVEGDPRTVWHDPTGGGPVGSVTAAQIEAVKNLIRADRDEIIRHGGKPTKLVAHRQSSGSRENDPGSEVWQRIAIPLMSELGLDDGGPGFAIADGFGGKPIPEAWDPTRVGIPY